MDPVRLILLRASLWVQPSQSASLIDWTSSPSTIPAFSALLLGVTLKPDTKRHDLESWFAVLYIARNALDTIRKLLRMIFLLPLEAKVNIYSNFR